MAGHRLTGCGSAVPDRETSMSKVVACYKWVVDEEDVRVAADLSVDLSKARMKLSNYDRNAIEAGVEVSKALDATLIGLSYGDAKLKKSVKEAASRGLDEVKWVVDDQAANADSARTASVLAAQIEKMEDVQVVLCADGSSDRFARQTAPRIAAKLGWPVVTAVSDIQVKDSTIVAQRQVAEGVETVEVGLPAVLAVLPEAAELRIPTLKAIMQASKKPNEQVPVAQLGDIAEPLVETVGQRGYSNNRKNVVFDASEESWFDELTAALRKEGVAQW